MPIKQELDVIFKGINEKRRKRFCKYVKRRVRIKYLKESLEDKVEWKDREI